MKSKDFKYFWTNGFDDLDHKMLYSEYVYIIARY